MVMGSVVLGIFDDRGQAEQAAVDLRDKGFHKDISVVARDEGKGDIQETRMEGGEEGNSPMAGITTGGTLGGLAGLAAGAGALVIPGIGPLIAMGPIAGLLSGAATGGIAGGLIDWGIPEAEGQHYEEDVRQGKTLVSVQGSEDRLNEAADILRRHGAHDVKIF
jgi:uncharacterized membrane protein